ncbi:MAG: DUF1553 domain-containing protein [Planctomycetes bacterium]|nr:DUF1553 domain-containing protein [Planctomycetota bacterium]
MTGSLLCLVGLGAVLPVGGAQKDEKKPVVYDVSWIDRLVHDRWAESKLKPSPAATDGEFVRRAYLDIVGHVPTAQEAREYIESKDKDKKGKLIGRLLAHEDYPKYWADIWSNLLIGRSPGRDINRAALQKYLRDCFAANKPWHKMVHELLTATGGSTEYAIKMNVPFNGATNFLLAHLGDRSMPNVPATSFATRLFLGVQVQCTQCHDHPFNDRKQDTFWGINAFFQRMKKEEHNDYSDTGQRIFRFAELKDAPMDSGEDLFVRYERRNALIEVVPPRWIEGDLKFLESRPDLNLREELAKLITSPDNKFFAQAIVNRMWGHFLGRGIVHPLDDLGEHNPPSNPELIGRLAQNFKESNYDLKRLITWITLSVPYNLSSKTTASNKEDDQLFSHYPLKQMSPEQFFDSLMVASQANKVGAKGWEDAEKMKTDLQRQFTTVFGNDENTEADTFNGTIPQALLLMNGNVIQKAISNEKGSFIHTRVEEIEKNKRVKAQEVALLNDLYLAAVSRYPNQREKVLAAQVLDATLTGAKPKNSQEWIASKVAAFQDIFWALLNSSEFVLNH